MPCSEEKKETYVNLPLDAQCHELLIKSANAHIRKKRQEAMIRVTDHLLRFDESWQEKSSEQEIASFSDDNIETHVNIKICAQCNETLNKSASSPIRNKREVAAIRLKDHLLRFDEMWQEKRTKQD